MNHEDGTKRRPEETVEGGFGNFWFRATGRRILFFVAILCGAAGPTYLLYAHDQKAEKMFAEINSAMKENNDIQQAQLWLMTISEDERKKLNLTRPKKIAEMQR